MSEVSFVLGGCRSGKSRHALELAMGAPGSRKVYVATCIPQDDEMEERVARHRQERGPEWQTVECPLELAQTLKARDGDGHVLLVDCLTMWVSNLILRDVSPEQLWRDFQDLAGILRTSTARVILVSNEVGGGVVPEYRLGRVFRDAVGQLNQVVAGAASSVTWTVAGIPVQIK